mmetsp:Transcript_18441/g.47146  ORF Transcript_18441/g.47146 Transcript_18441/m.47146 type:complete len:652 (-) Transcript_18441:108-2063(-)
MGRWPSLDSSRSSNPIACCPLGRCTPSPPNELACCSMRGNRPPSHCPISGTIEALPVFTRLTMFSSAMSCCSTMTRPLIPLTCLPARRLSGWPEAEGSSCRRRSSCSSSLTCGEAAAAAAADAGASKRRIRGEVLRRWQATAGAQGLRLEHAGAALGWRLVAARSFAQGEVLLLAPPAATAMDESAAEAVCHACMGPPAEGATLRRCSGCQFAHYCSEAHQKLAWAQMGHAAECKLIATAKPRTPTRSMRLAAIAAHVSLKAAPGWHAEPGALLSLQPRDGSADGTDSDVAAVALLVARLLAASGLTPPPRPDYLSALLARLRCNGHTLHDSQLQPHGAGLYPLASLVNHACLPNASASFQFRQFGASPSTPAEVGSGTTVAKTSADTTDPGPAQSGRQPRRPSALCLILRATRHLARGEPLSVSYIDLAAPFQARQLSLARGYGFACTCAERCLNVDTAHSPAWLYEALIAGVNCPQCQQPCLQGFRGSGETACTKNCPLDISAGALAIRTASDAQSDLAVESGDEPANAALAAAVLKWMPKLPSTNVHLYNARVVLIAAALDAQDLASARLFACASSDACALINGKVSAPFGLLALKRAKLLALDGQTDMAALAAREALEALTITNGLDDGLCAEIARDFFEAPGGLAA